MRLVHKYPGTQIPVVQNPMPHPALREGVVAKLLSFVSRAMAIARLTHLRISVPLSGAPPGEVPNDCFPETDIPAVTPTSRMGNLRTDYSDDDGGHRPPR